MKIEKVLLVEDDPLMRPFILEVLRRRQWQVFVATTALEAKELITKECFELIITDIRLPDESGIDILCFAKKINARILVILTTAYASVETAVEAMRHGAFNYLIKPFSQKVLDAVIEKALEHEALYQENERLKHQIEQKSTPGQKAMIATSPLMQQIMESVGKVAKSCASVFISGESGTGKEVIASAIHYSSQRALQPFIRVNCAAIPHTLLESEFFGHEKGAFTGAIARRQGRFELADKGTLLLDEISEIPLEIQPKLLRAIQEMEFERVGGNSIIKVDTRLIATSNRVMKEMIEKKLFREDLYYRLNVVPIHLPPLRDRREDIIPLCEFFLDNLFQENPRNRKTLSDAARRRLLDYPWPGNIRELANVIERSVVLNSERVIEPGDLLIDTSCPIPAACKAPTSSSKLYDVEKEHILRILAAHSGNKTHAAKALGISLRTLRNKVRDYEGSISVQKDG